MTADIRHDATPEPAGGVGDHEAAPALAIGIKIGTDVSIAVGAHADGWAGTVTRPTLGLAGRDDFLPRIGDPVGLVDAAGDPVFAEALYAQAVHRLLTETLEATGADPRAVQVTFAVPDGWSPAVIADVARAVQAATGLTADRCAWTSAAVTAVTAVEHATGAFADGDPVVVYDFGASATTVTVLAAGADPTPLTRPLTSTLVSGRDIDRLLLDHTLEATGLGQALGARIDDPSILADLTELRRRCRTAKETLSTDTGTAVDISVGPHRTEARLVREDVDELVRGPVLESVSLVRDALAAAAVDPRRVAAIVAVGGGSTVPIVSELLESALHIPVILDPDPAGAAAVGAALISADRLAGAGAADDATALLAAAAAAPLPASAPVHAVEPAPVSENAPAQRLSNRKRGVLVALGVVVIAVFTAAGLSVGTGLVGSTKPTTPAPAEGAVPSGSHGASTAARSTPASAQAGGSAPSESGRGAPAGTAGRNAATGTATSAAAGAPAASTAPQAGPSAASTAAPQPSASNGGATNGGATNGGTTGGGTGSGSDGGSGNTDTGGTDDGSGGGAPSGGSGNSGSGSGSGIGGAVRQLPGDVLGGVGQITCGLVGLPACP